MKKRFAFTDDDVRTLIHGLTRENEHCLSEIRERRESTCAVEVLGDYFAYREKILALKKRLEATQPQPKKRK